MASLAALAPLLMPPITRSLGAYATATLGFLRYYRMVSPASHVLLLLLAIVLVREVSAGPSARREVAAGLAIGLVFYTPMYYWTLLVAGVAVLAVASAVRNRLALLRVLVLGALVGAPALYHTRLASQSQMVRETLTRELILYPGRTPHLLEMALFALTTAILVVLWIRRRSAGPAFCFLAPFLACGAVFFLQCVVTGLHVQEFHWAHTITPLAYLALAACFQNEILRARSVVTAALIAALFVGGTFAQINGYRQWEGARRTDADVWDVRDAIPQTLAFLRTQPPLVVLGSDNELLDSVVLYAPVKVYWSTFASQYAVSDEEAAERARAVATWRPSQPYPLKYEADLYLAVGRECREPSTLLLVYSNAAEHTCLFRIPALFSGMR